MTSEQFKILIETLEKIKNRTNSIYNLGIDLIQYDEDYQKIISLLLECAFNEDGKGWIDWYLYERIGFDGKVLEAWDENGDKICHDIESLWETVKPYRRQ